MVAHFTMRTYGVNQKFRFDEGIWLHRKSGQIRFFFGKQLFLHQECATCSEQPSHIKTMHSPEKSTVINAPVPFHWKSIKFEVTEEVLESTLNFSTSLNGKKTNFKCQLQLDNQILLAKSVADPALDLKSNLDPEDKTKSIWIRNTVYSRLDLICHKFFFIVRADTLMLTQ